MTILTKSEFATIANSKVGYKILNTSRKFSKDTAITSVFLSHSHHDKDVVLQAKAFFENLGVSVYVDWADETMPENTSGVTAQKIKHQISGNDKFILLATNNAIASKWCNWEVGIGDIYKLWKNKIAILPLADNNKTWNGSEYLQIYPRVEQYVNDYYVFYPNGSKESVSVWLKRT